jgi:hypothetical protein
MKSTGETIPFFQTENFFKNDEKVYIHLSTDFPDFVDDVDLLKIAVTYSKELLSCSWVPAWVKSDAEICYYAVIKGNILQLEYVSSTLKSNAIFVAAVLSAKPNAAKCFSATQIQSAAGLGKIPEKKFLEMIKN